LEIIEEVVVIEAETEEAAAVEIEEVAVALREAAVEEDNDDFKKKYFEKNWSIKPLQGTINNKLCYLQKERSIEKCRKAV
jgi:hypothetical protein